MDDENDKIEIFSRSKQATLARDDLSRKGSIDKPIVTLVTIINDCQFYYTTSTCSGRITLIEKPHGKSGIKKGNKFHLSSHELIDPDVVIKVVGSFACSQTSPDHEQCLWFKFEPFILHIQCYDLMKAKSLLNIALQAGCRNSGLTLGKSDKIMLAIRSTSSMEIPIHCGTLFKVSKSYIEFLCQESNRRLTENFERLAKLQADVNAFVESGQTN